MRFLLGIYYEKYNDDLRNCSHMQYSRRINHNDLE